MVAGLALYAVSQIFLPAWMKLVIGSVITGLALGSLLTTNKIGRALSVWVAALLLLGFCVLTGFSVGIFFLPAALVSLSLSVVFSFSRTTD